MVLAMKLSTRRKVDFETIGYCCSKTALNMLMLDWYHELKQNGVKVWGGQSRLFGYRSGQCPRKGTTK
jgi:hypothetical protein